ncbi:MAG: NfeD family protein [Frankiaceae bacterium]|jgi:membrane protein implicated in regulation of membrane protease activity|nr:NfeD family protein [Frankiaceae bacterium]
MPAWLIWIIVAAGLAAAETLSLDLVLIMLAGGAGAGALAAGLGAPVAVQALVAAAATLLLLGGARPVVKRHLSGRGEVAMGVQALVGKPAKALTDVDAEGGRVQLNGGEWSARAFDPTQRICAGASVRVMEISGATAIVWEDM